MRFPPASALILLVALTGPLARAETGPGGAERPALRLRARTFVPGETRDLGRPAAGERVHRILQFAALPDAEERAALAAAGVRLVAYVPERAFLASLPSGMRADHPAMAAVRYAGPLEPADKLSPLLAPARSPSGLAPREVRVWFHGDVPVEEGLEAVRGRGFSARRTPDGEVVVELGVEVPDRLAGLDVVQWVAPPAPRLVTHNDGMRAAVEVAPLYQAPYDLDGSSARLGIWDGSVADTAHPDLSGRVTVGAGQTVPPSCDASSTCRHASHVLGIAAGDGSASVAAGGSPGQWQGVAPGVSIFSYDFAGNIAAGGGSEVASAIAGHDIDQTQNSWGYCIDANDPGCAPCSTFGDYESLARDQDAVVHGDLGKALTVVFSCGNSRNDTGSGCVTDLGVPFLNWSTLSPPSTAKNAIAVGAVNSDDLSMTRFSSWGPTDDGRLKPDLVAPGCENEATRNDADPDRSIWSVRGGSGTYEGSCGTSMAAPVVSGAVSLLVDDVFGRTGSRPRPHTVRAALFHTAADLTSTTGAHPGPDYATGWGLVQVRSAVDRLRTDGVFTDVVAGGEEMTYEVDVPPGTAQLKATLVWDDPPASLLADPALVNDLDLVVLSPSGARAYPWTLDPMDPSAAASRDAEDHRNPVEQVLVDTPEEGIWSLAVRGTAVPMAGPQAFTLIADPPANPVSFGLEAPGEGSLYFPDSPPVSFVWSRGTQATFKVELSSSPGFGKPRKTSGKRWLTASSYTPSPDAWLKVLKLGKTAPVVYWRVRAKDAAGSPAESETWSFQVASAEAPTVTAPADGAAVPAGSPPTLVWAADHNAEYRVIFSASPTLGKPRATSGKGYPLSGTSWAVDAAVWSKIVDRLAPRSPDGTVYYAIFARDALRRSTAGAVRTLRVQP